MADQRTRLRPIDLARTAGISTQQVRNYEEAGVLPPADRSPTGYRRFETRHQRALLTYRALATGYGWDTAGDVMRAVHDGDRPRALALLDANHSMVHEMRISLQTTGEALEAVADQSPDETPLPSTELRIGEAAALLGVRTSALRVWEASGLLAPRRERFTEYRYFSATDIRDARMIKMLRQGHYRIPQIRPILDGLRETGSRDALRAAIAQRQATLTRRSTAMLDGSSQLHHYLTETD